MGTDYRDLQKRIASSEVSQERVAVMLGIHPTQFSRYIRGLLPPPEGFEELVAAMLERLEQAEQAAQEARERVLGTGAP